MLNKSQLTLTQTTPFLLFYLCLLISTALAASPASLSVKLPSSHSARTEIEEHRLILRFQSPQEALAAKLPKEFKIIKRYDANVVIESQRPLSEALSRQLHQSVPTLVRIDRDFSMHLQQTAVSAGGQKNTATCTPPPATDPLVNTLNAINDKIQVHACSYTRKCPESGMAMNWDEQMINLDLMQEDIKQLNLTHSTPVAVVDSRIDKSALQYMNAEVTWKKNSLFDTSKTDPLGHGSFVASLISRAALTSHLNSYSIFKSENTENSTTEDALLRACKDGNPIINLSAGENLLGLNLNMGALSPDLPKKLKEKGCLLIQSAGNSAGKEAHFLRDDVASNFLTVGSVDFTGEKSSFSDIGMVYAPGNQVAGYYPPESEISKLMTASNDTPRCSTDLTLSSGTSYSAPIIAGIAKNLADVLLSSSNPPPNIAGELRTLIKMAARPPLNIIDAELALQWALFSSDYSNTPKAKELAKKNSVDANGPKNCSEITDCTQQQACTKRLRRALSPSFSSKPTQQNLVAELFRTYHQNGEYELAAYWKSKLDPQNTPASLDWSNLNARIDTLTDLAQLNQYLSLVKPVPESTRQAIENRLYSLLTQNKPFKTDALNFNFAQNQLTQLNSWNNPVHLGERLLNTAKVQTPANDVSLATATFALQLGNNEHHTVAPELFLSVLNHPGIGPVTESVLILSSKNLPTTAANAFYEKILNKKDLPDSHLVLLIINLSGSALTGAERVKWFQAILSHSKCTAKILSELTARLPSLFPDEALREQALFDLLAASKMQNALSREQLDRISYVIASFNTPTSLKLLQQLGPTDYFGKYSRGNLIFNGDFLKKLNFEETKKLYSLIDQSRDGFTARPLNEFEAAQFLMYSSLSREQKISLLRNLGASKLPPEKNLISYMAMTTLTREEITQIYGH